MTIIRINIPKQSNYNEKSRTFTGIVTQITEKEEQITYKIKNKELVLGTLYLKNQKPPKVCLGDKVTVIGTFRKPKKNTITGSFNYRQYCYRNNIFYLVDIKSLKVIKKNNNFLYFFKQKIKEQINQDAYLNTFIVGDKSYIKENVKRSYQENGVSHLFAISGRS